MEPILGGDLPVAHEKSKEKSLIRVQNEGLSANFP
jgi:hypothetical protein